MRLWKAVVLLFVLSGGLSFADLSGPFVYGEADLADSKASDVRPLSFYVGHLPVIGRDEKGELETLRWQKRKPTDPQISIERIDGFPGQLCVVSYIPMKFLKLGVIRKSGILILQPVRARGSTVGHKAVYYQDAGSGGTVETFTHKTQKLLEEESFLTITCHYSGTGGHTSSQYFRWKDFKLTPHAVWAPGLSFSDEIKAAGWEPWHRGHWKSPLEKAEYTTVYRKSEDADGGRSGHATIKIDYEWVNEQLTAKSWHVMPEDWRYRD